MTKVQGERGKGAGRSARSPRGHARSTRRGLGLSGLVVLAAGAAAVAGWSLANRVGALSGVGEVAPFAATALLAALLVLVVRRALSSRTNPMTPGEGNLDTHLLLKAVEQSPSAVVITDPQGKVVYVNPRFVEITGWSFEEIRGKNPRVLKSGKMSDDVYSDLWATIRVGGTWRGELLNRTRSGEDFWVFAAISGVRNGRGAITHFISVKEDITRRKEAEAELVRLSSQLDRQRSLLDEVLRATPDAILMVDREGVVAFANRAAQDAAAEGAGQLTGRRWTELPLTASAAERLELDRQQVLVSARSVGGQVSVTGNGVDRELEYTLVPVPGDEGAPETVVATLRDVTQRETMERALRASEEKYRLLFSRVFDAVSLFDAESGEFLDANDAYLEMVGYTREELLSMSTFQLSAEPEQSLATRDELVNNGTARVPVRWLKRRDGTVFPVELSAGTFAYRGRSVVCAISRDITERLRTQETLERLSTTDSLTGVANRRVFDEELREEWKRAGRDGSPISLVMLDIDAFKPFNDTYGHQAGDACLRQVADVMSQAVRRAGDLVARYGGEEFVALMPGTSHDGAVEVAELIRRQVEALSIVHEASSAAPVVTVSLGVAGSVPSACCSPEQLLKAADEALYRAKRDGRNRVESARLLASPAGQNPESRRPQA